MVDDHKKSRKELIDELTALRQRVANLEKEQDSSQQKKSLFKFSDSQFRAVIEQSPISVAFFSPEGKITYINRSWQKMWNIPSEQLDTYNALEDEQLINLGTKPYLEKAFSGEAITLPLIYYEPHLVGLTGHSCWVEASAYPIKDEAGKILQVIVTQKDVTEQKTTENALRKIHEALEQRVAERTLELSKANDLLTRQLSELLQASEEQEILKQILENIPLMIDYYDEEGNILLVNNAWEEFFGWSLERLHAEGSQKFFRSILPDPQYRRKVFTHMAEGKTGWHDLTVTLTDKQGYSINVETCWIIIRLSNGKTIGIGQDISERKKAERALRKSEETIRKSEQTLRAVLEGVEDCIYMKDLEGNYLIINTACATAFQRDAADVLGNNDLALFPLETANVIRKVDKIVVETKNRFHGDDYIKVGNEIRVYSTTKVPYFNPQGGIDGIIGISRDITERVQAQEALASQKERLAVTLRAIADGVITVDTQGCILLINKAAEGMMGISTEDAIGRPLSKIITLLNEKTRKSCTPLVTRALKLGKPTERMHAVVLITNNNNNGEERIISDTAAPIRDQEGHMVGAVMVFRDITEKRKFEEKLLRERAARVAAKITEAKLEQTNVQLQALSAHVIKAQEEERIRLARELHDELGQSLTSIKLSLELAVATLSTGNRESLGRLLNELCTYVETAAKDVQRVARDLRPSVLDDFGLAAALESYSRAYSKRTGIEVTLSLDPISRFLTKEEETAFYRIAQEALTNVAKHSGAKTVSIDMTERNGITILTIIDDGRGFSTKKKPLLRESSTGFGLLGMGERARIIGANLLIKTRPGEGFCLQLSLPAKRSKL